VDGDRRIALRVGPEGDGEVLVQIEQERVIGIDHCAAGGDGLAHVAQRQWPLSAVGRTTRQGPVHIGQVALVGGGLGLENGERPLQQRQGRLGGIPRIENVADPGDEREGRRSSG
jgi:hypothetical protein